MNKITRWYDTGDPRFTIIECSSCKTPMVVWRDHTLYVSPRDAQDMFWALAAVADKVIGKNKWYLRTQQGSIFDHLHWHAERKRRKNPPCVCYNLKGKEPYLSL